MGVVIRVAVVLGTMGLSAASGCSGASVAAERQMDAFRKDIARVQADNERLNERVSALERTQEKGTAGAAGVEPVEQVPKLKVVKLAPGQDPDAQVEQPGESGTDTADNGETTVIRAEGDRTAQITRTPGREKAKDGGRSGSAREYENAMGLVKRKQYDKALEALAGFLVRYPDDANADNAMYWRGESYYAKGEYARAAEEFSGLLARFPHGNKVSDALLKLGMSQLKGGDKAKASATFAQLRRDYPSSEAARKIPRE